MAPRISAKQGFMPLDYSRSFLRQEEQDFSVFSDKVVNMMISFAVCFHWPQNIESCNDMILFNSIPFKNIESTES